MALFMDVHTIEGGVGIDDVTGAHAAKFGYDGGYFQNGNREQTNNYTLDGADINETIDNYIGYSPNVDAIGELKIITDSVGKVNNNVGLRLTSLTPSVALPEVPRAEPWRVVLGHAHRRG